MGAGGIVGAIVRWLAEFRVNKAVALNEVLSVDVRPDRKTILSLALEKKLAAAWLKARNLRVATDGEEIVIKVAEQLVKSETTDRLAA